MAQTAIYTTTVERKGEHRGHIRMSTGPEMDFSAPPDAHGHAGVLCRADTSVSLTERSDKQVPLSAENLLPRSILNPGSNQARSTMPRASGRE